MKRFIPVLGALVLAVLGSALWEALRNPIIFASFLMLRLLTLGVDSFRDSIYADAAAQIPERAGSLILVMLTGITTGVICTTMFEYRKGSRNDDEYLPIREISGSSKKAGISMLRFFIIAALLSLFIISNRQIYVIRASAYANQLQKIAAPFLTDKQILVYSSSLAQVQTRSGYVELVEDLRRVISGNKAIDPGFAIF